MDSQYLMKIWKLLKNTIFGDSKISGSKYAFKDAKNRVFFLCLARNRKTKYRANVKQNTAKS